MLYTRTLNAYYVCNYVVASVYVERTYVLLLRCDNVVQNCNCTILANLTQNGSRHVAIRKPPILKCIIIIIQYIYHAMDCFLDVGQDHYLKC